MPTPKADGRRIPAPQAKSNFIRSRVRNASVRGGWTLRIALLGSLAAGLAGCGRGGDQPAQAVADAQPGYVKPPQVLVAARLLNGGEMIAGQSEPGARIRLSSPSGAAYGATAQQDGGWTIPAPAANQVRLFGLSEDLGGRLVQGEGYIVLLPSPGRAGALLRAGDGAAALSLPTARPQIVAIDFDSGGGAVVSGAAKPGSALKVSLDGAPAGETRADSAGLYTIDLAAMLKAGDHALLVESTAGSANVKFTAGPPATISGLPYRGERQAGMWRVDWLTPSGGGQTTLIVDPSE
jgi:hypothetical protein